MPSSTRIQIAKQDIVREFSQRSPILRLRDVAEIFNEKRDFWRLAKTMKLAEFLRFMTENTDLKLVSYQFPKRHVSGYTWGYMPFLETLLGLVEDSYLSHYTALRIHGLTEQVPKTIYFTKEKTIASASSHNADELYKQSTIDAVFSNPPRSSKNELELIKEQVRVVMLESAYHGGLGVIESEVNWGDTRPLKLRHTSLERTMIDVVVRPFYAGGVFEVAKAFENARTRLSVNTMLSMLKRMAFGYPYHQAIGYYLERAGYKSSVVNLFQQLPMERDFYIAYNMEKITYNKRWRLFIPEGF